MGDTELADAFRAMRVEKQKRAARAREEMPRYLHSRGIAFDSKNYGAHLIVYGENVTVDYWPGTGLWIPRNTGLRKKGVDKLVDYIRNPTR